MDKRVDEFLRLISQTLDSDLLKQDEISVVDLGCGHAYLTFAVGEFLKDKYKQVDEFLRLISQTLDADLSNKDEISVVDLGCGHAYLTFAVQEFLKDKYKNVSILGVDERDDSKAHNEKVAAKLKTEAKFIAAKIADTPNQKVDIAIALHACEISS